MRLTLQLFGCLALLSVACASLVEDQQSCQSLEPAPSLTYNGRRLRCFQIGEARIVEPYITMRLPKRALVRRDPLGEGFYFTVPLQITSSIKLPPAAHRKWQMLDVHSFKVQLRQAEMCSSKCPKVSVIGEWKRGRSPLVRFRCSSHSACQRLLRSLRFTGERSSSLRAALKFQFFGKVNSTQYILNRVGLPIANAVKRPFSKAFWFEGDKLLLYTIKANTGLLAFETFESEQNYAIPRDGSLPDVYRSDLLDRLSAVASSANFEIVAEMRKNGRTVAQVVFSADPKGLTKDTFFTPERLISSKPYWIGHIGYNFFSTAGHPELRRRFFINRSYGGCPNDMGFWVVSDQRDPCTWANGGFGGRTPTLVYTAYDKTYYQSGSSRFADNFLIYLRLARPSLLAAPAMRGAYQFEKNKILLFTVAENSNHQAAATFLNSGIKHSVPTGSSLPSVFRSELVDSIGLTAARSGMHYIVAEMRAGSRMVSQVVFDVSVRRAELNKENWFAKDRVVSSYPYPVGTTFNFFSVRGDTNFGRSFFIGFNYGGCGGDRAFWVVSDRRDPCEWANKLWKSGPTLMYTTSRAPTLQPGGAKHDADRFLVYLM